MQPESCGFSGSEWGKRIILGRINVIERVQIDNTSDFNKIQICRAKVYLIQDYEMRNCCQHSLTSPFLNSFCLFLVNLVIPTQSSYNLGPYMCRFHGVRNMMGAGVRKQTPPRIPLTKGGEGFTQGVLNEKGEHR